VSAGVQTAHIEQESMLAARIEEGGGTALWEEWWIHRQAVLPSSETWTGWKAGHRGT